MVTLDDYRREDIAYRRALSAIRQAAYKPKDEIPDWDEQPSRADKTAARSRALNALKGI